MIVDIECPRCRGEGWLLQRAPRLGPGLYEVTCEHCNGHGVVAVDAEDAGQFQGYDVILSE